MDTKLPSPWRFAATFIAVFFVSAVTLFAVDFVPEKPGADGQVAGAQTTTVAEVITPEEPVAIKIPSVGIDTVIMNPTSTSVKLLDEALLSGAVHYPTSAKLGELGMVYVFGHQSRVPVVKNPNYKSFNNLQNVKPGDEITVYSANAAYTYRVATVEMVNAADALIALSTDGRRLTLSTCNSFGQKSDRYVVTADFITRTPFTNIL